MDQASGLLTLLGRGPGIAVLPGAARRFRQHEKKKNKEKKPQKTRKGADTVDNPVFFPRFLAKKPAARSTGAENLGAGG